MVAASTKARSAPPRSLRRPVRCGRTRGDEAHVVSAARPERGATPATADERSSRSARSAPPAAGPNTGSTPRPGAIRSRSPRRPRARCPRRRRSPALFLLPALHHRMALVPPGPVDPTWAMNVRAIASTARRWWGYRPDVLASEACAARRAGSRARDGRADRRCSSAAGGLLPRAPARRDPARDGS